MAIPEGSELLRTQEGVQQVRQQRRRHEEQDERGRVQAGGLEPGGDARVEERGGEAGEDEQ
jgi:hypothetical protein